jgi:hypothetical protein
MMAKCLILMMLMSCMQSHNSPRTAAAISCVAKQKHFITALRDDDGVVDLIFMHACTAFNTLRFKKLLLLDIQSH